jgi:hypothetical protein
MVFFQIQLFKSVDPKLCCYCFAKKNLFGEISSTVDPSHIDWFRIHTLKKILFRIRS